MNAEEFYQPTPKESTLELIEEIKACESIILKTRMDEDAVLEQMEQLKAQLLISKNARNHYRKKRFILTARLAFMEGL